MGEFGGTTMEPDESVPEPPHGCRDLWLAAEMKAPLATFDRRLGVAAQRHLSALQ
jgi:hypothetical protein